MFRLEIGGDDSADHPLRKKVERILGIRMPEPTPLAAARSGPEGPSSHAATCKVDADHLGAMNDHDQCLLKLTEKLAFWVISLSHNQLGTQFEPVTYAHNEILYLQFSDRENTMKMLNERLGHDPRYKPFSSKHEIPEYCEDIAYSIKASETMEKTEGTKQLKRSACRTKVLLLLLEKPQQWFVAKKTSFTQLFVPLSVPSGGL